MRGDLRLHTFFFLENNLLVSKSNTPLPVFSSSRGQPVLFFVLSHNANEHTFVGYCVFLVIYEGVPTGDTFGVRRLQESDIIL